MHAQPLDTWRGMPIVHILFLIKLTMKPDNFIFQYFQKKGVNASLSVRCMSNGFSPALDSSLLQREGDILLKNLYVI